VSDESRKIDLGTHALRVRDTGGGAPSTVVLLHDFLDGTEVWDPLLPLLAGSERAVRVQQRGHGDSTAPEGACSVDDLAADVVALLGALGLERPVVLVGHRFGALVAAKAALRAPERAAGLVLIAPFSELDPAAAKQWWHVVRAGEVNKLQGLARSVFGPTSRRAVDGDGIALTEIARALQGLGSKPETAALAAVRCPTVVLAGENDGAGTTAARGVAAAIPGSRLEVVPGAGTAPHADAPDAVLRAIRGVTTAA
jgi:pimeloyl-ACP methyl ester carboxylesterase